jgi:iron-sulfur cluster repair protein YtfE (RIC family)
MNESMPSLPETHADLRPHVERLRVVADHIGETSGEQLGADLSEIRTFLHGRLMPHALAEASVLYPAVQWALNSSSATLGMAQDHAEIGRLSAELDGLLIRTDQGGLSVSDLTELRRILYCLYAIISIHFAKEAEIYHPLLRQCFSPREIEELEEDMEVAEMARTAELTPA